MLQERWDRRRKHLSVTGGVTFDELVDSYYEQALALDRRLA